MSLDSKISEPPSTQHSRAFNKAIALWIPRQFINTTGVDILGFIEDVNDKVTHRGFILWDGQILTTPIIDRIDKSTYKPKAQIMSETENYIWKVAALTDSVKVGRYTELYCPYIAPDSFQIAPYITFEVPPKRDWGAAQKNYFRLENPYQMAEDAEDYTQLHIMTYITESYLAPDEKIAAILHGERDNYYFYCMCHEAAVVYTTRHRFVCMGCGALHAVLCHPLSLRPKRLLTVKEWIDFFNDEGARRDEEVEVSIVDFQDIEDAETIWTTDQWDEAKHRFVFFARSTEEEIVEATRCTEADPSIFLEAGWIPTETSPPPANQVSDNSIDIDLIENTAHSIREGVSSFLKARKKSEQLVTAILHLFRAVEVILKAKLKILDQHSLKDRPNNPTVIKRLERASVFLTKSELNTVVRLRHLRNELQHGEAKFNYRTGLAVSREAIIFLDRFAYRELGLWVGDVIPSDNWFQLLTIPQIECTAEDVTNFRLDEIRQNSDTKIFSCSRCGREAMVRPHPNTGASCTFCGYIPESSSKPYSTHRWD